MNYTYRILTISLMMFIVFAMSNCSRTNKPSVDEGEEESNTELALNETYDKVRNGARLILAYNAQSNSFEGTVENTTAETLKQVRVEVHLSNGKELGPTPSTDLAPGEKTEVQLIATSTDFNGWTAHPEVGEGEHGHREEHSEHDSEHGGEHDREGKNEHN
ncbi:FxLYD domain-containing protein [Candidatus Poribacteria bacterium]|nr:FxLYD domain-containing protein [Candidatus Poribacteria bacterium]